MKFCYLVCKMFNNLVRSGRTCPANLGVQSCPVRKLICPVRLSHTFLHSAVGRGWKKSLWPVGPIFHEHNRILNSRNLFSILNAFIVFQNRNLLLNISWYIWENRRHTRYRKIDYCFEFAAAGLTSRFKTGGNFYV